MGLGTTVLPLKLNLYNSTAVLRIAECDAVFGGMDTSEGRHLLNRIATFYVVPYFDLGVHLAADVQGGINEASGVVHYLQPGLSSLLSRKGYTLEQVRAEGIRRTNPAAYSEQRRLNYIEGVDEHAPAVASVNASIASLAVNEFLAGFTIFDPARTGTARLSVSISWRRPSYGNPNPAIRASF